MRLVKLGVSLQDNCLLTHIGFRNSLRRFRRYVEILAGKIDNSIEKSCDL